jgi:hypothetical protein
VATRERRVPVRVNALVNGRAPYTRGWLAPWRGQWGPLADGHSRLGRERKRQEARLLQEYPGQDPLDLRREAAELRAIAAMIRAQFGLDAKVTVRKVTAVQKTAAMTLALLVSTQQAAQNGRGPRPLAELVEQDHVHERSRASAGRPGTAPLPAPSNALESPAGASQRDTGGDSGAGRRDA